MTADRGAPSVGKFRKKPVVIEAVQFDGTPGSAVAVFDAMGLPSAKFSPEPDLQHGAILIPTLEGMMRANAGDWIIRGVKGESISPSTNILPV